MSQAHLLEALVSHKANTLQMMCSMPTRNSQLFGRWRNPTLKMSNDQWKRLLGPKIVEDRSSLRRFGSINLRLSCKWPKMSNWHCWLSFQYSTLMSCNGLVLTNILAGIMFNKFHSNVDS